jgi:tetratricopeptide (TPR) repeat protein
MYATVVDRYAYLAMLGPAIAVAWALSRPIVLRRRLPVAVAVGAALVAMAGKTFTVAGYWHDDRTLFAHAVQVNHESWMAHDHLSFGLLRTDPAAAVTEAQIAQRLRPDFVPAHRTLASAYSAAGDRPAAIRELRILLDSPSQDSSDVIDQVNLRSWLARLLVETGDTAGAIEQYRRCLQLQPDNPVIQTDLAAELAETGHPEQAIPLYRAALRTAPKLEAARRGLTLAEKAAATQP